MQELINIFNIILIQPLANGLILFYNLLGQNFGIAIIAFSTVLRLVLTPLTKPYMDSMKRIKELAPNIQKLKAKYKGDKMKFAQAQADLYKEKGINPSAGCLPYILQIVVLIAFFNVFSNTIYSGDVVANFNKLLYPALKFMEGQTINTSFLYLDLTKPDIFRIPSIPFPIPGPLLILSALIQFFSAKMMMPLVAAEKKVSEKTKGEEDDIQVAMQQSSLYTFPLFTLFFGVQFPSALALYWIMFSLFQMVQQYGSSGWGGATPWLKKLGLLK